ncbi:hypothetical protein Tco_1315315 [Tanacetum coccineum]
MDLVTKLTDRVEVLENDLQQTKQGLHKFPALTKLIVRVNKLRKVKTNKARRRARIVISEDEDAEEDSSKQGRKISEIDKDPTILLVHPEQDMEYDFDVSTAKGFTTASVPITTPAIRLQEHFDEEERQRLARQEQEKYNLEKALELQKQLDKREEVVAKVNQDHD